MSFLTKFSTKKKDGYRRVSEENNSTSQESEHESVTSKNTTITQQQQVQNQSEGKKDNQDDDIKSIKIDFNGFTPCENLKSTSQFSSKQSTSRSNESGLEFSDYSTIYSSSTLDAEASSKRNTVIVGWPGKENGTSLQKFLKSENKKQKRNPKIRKEVECQNFTSACNALEAIQSLLPSFFSTIDASQNNGMRTPMM